MKLSKILISFIMGLIYISCTPSKHLNNIKVELFDNGHALTFSSFLEEYKIISLSSNTSEAMIKYPDRLLFFGNRIFVMDRGGNKIIVYDRNGKFLKSTAQMVGRGHNEYIRVIDASIDEKDKKLYVHCNAPYQMMIFDLNLNLEKTIPMDYYMGEIAIEGNQLYGICYNKPKDGGGYSFVTVNKNDLKKEPTILLSFENAITGRWTLGKSLMPCRDGVYVCLPFDTRIYKFKDATITEEYNMDFGEQGLIEHPVTKDMNPRWFDKYYRDINWSIVNMTESDSILLFNTNKAHAFIMNKNQYQCSGHMNLNNDIFPISCARIIPSQGLSNGVVYFIIPSSIEKMLEQAKKGKETLTPAIKEFKQKFDPNGNPLLIVWNIK